MKKDKINKDKSDKILTINYASESPNFGKVGCGIKIMDGVAVHKFTDARYARFMYEKEKEVNKNIIFKERLSTYAEEFIGEKKEDIAKHFLKHLKEHNIKVKEK